MEKQCMFCGSMFVCFTKRKTCSELCRYKSSSKNSFGKKISSEHRKKLSSIRKGRTWEDIYGVNKAFLLRKQRSIKYSGMGNPFYGKNHTENTIQKIKEANYKKHGEVKTPEHKRKIREANLRISHIHRQNTINFLKAGGMPNKRTSIEKEFSKTLEINNIRYEEQKAFKLGIADFYLTDYDTYVFCDGDYWHNYPVGKERDKLQVEYLKVSGHGAFRCWERDINNDCGAIITKIISLQ